MAFKDNIDPQIRGFYFSGSGDSDFDGTTIEVPKPTMQEAIDEANAVTPPPAGDDLVVVSSAQGGSFTAGFVLEDFIQFNGTNVTLTEDTAIAIDLASFLLCIVTSCSNAMDGGICFNINAKTFLSIEVELINVFGIGGIGFNTVGVVDNVFGRVKQVSLVGNESIGVNILSEHLTPVDFNMDTISLVGDDCIAINYNPVNTLDQGIIDVSTIESVNSTGGSGFIVESGSLKVRVSALNAPTAVHVKAGAFCTFAGSEVVGDIIVDSGGQLDVAIVKFTGNITNNGILNGSIAGVLFGTWRAKPTEESVLIAASFVVQSPVLQDVLLQIEFGAAQNGPSDPVEIDAAGSITINQSDQYVFRARFHYARSGAGSFATLFTRLLVDGIQVGPSQPARLDNPNTHLSIDYNTPLNLLAGQVLEVQMWRDGAGFNAGEIVPDTPTLVGPNPTPSAQLTMTRYRNIQPVD